MEYLESIKDEAYKGYLKKLKQHSNDPVMKSVLSIGPIRINTETTPNNANTVAANVDNEKSGSRTDASARYVDNSPGRRYRRQSVFEAHANTMVRTHWEFMAEMAQTISLDLLRQEEKLQQALAIKGRNKPTKDSGKKNDNSEDSNSDDEEGEQQQQSNEITEIIKKTQTELTELSMSQAVEISKITEEMVFGMLREEEQLEKFYKDEISKIEKQLGDNSPTKVKIIQKLNEKKDIAKKAAMKKIEEAKSKKLIEINQKYDTFRAEKMKASEDILKLRLFSATATAPAKPPSKEEASVNLPPAKVSESVA